MGTALAAGVAEDILALDAHAIAALTPVMAAAQAELAADLQKWLKLLGPNAVTQKYTAAHIRHVQLLLGIAQQQARTPHAPFPNVVARALAQIMGGANAPGMAVGTLQSQLDALASHFADMSAPQLNQAAWFAKGDKLVLDRYANSAARYAGNVKQDLKFQFGVGLAKGETLGQLVNRIANISSFQQAVNPALAGPAGSAMAAGLTQRYKFWAERLARTELINSYNAFALKGIHEVHKVDNRVEVMWDASLDHRVCPVCRSLHGKKTTPGETFPGGYLHPPAHPFCRCAAVAWIQDDWEDDPAFADHPAGGGRRT